MLVDDQALVREGLRAVVEKRAGCKVVAEAASGEAALEQVRTIQPHVVILNIQLPGGDGIEISRKIKAEFPGVKIIAISGDLTMAILHEALCAGIAACVLKEDPAEEVTRALGAALDHQVYLCPQLTSMVVKHYLHIAGKPLGSQARRLLTGRESCLLKLIAEGRRNKEMAEAMGITVNTVETFRTRLMKKLGCASTNEMVHYALREGIAEV